MQNKKNTQKFITPAHVGGHPECFMCFWVCPVCGCCNEDTFLIDGADYLCDGCCSILEFKVPKKKPRKYKYIQYSYLLTRNGL